MARFYLPPDRWSEGTLVLEGDEARHGTQVLRLKQGDELALFDGHGKSVACHLEAIEGRGRIFCVPNGEVQLEQAPTTQLHLAPALLKGKNLDLVLQKATELGVDRITPLITDRTVARPDSRDLARKREKWQRTVLEAAKQCGRNWLPEICDPITATEFFRELETDEIGFVGALEGDRVALRTELSGAKESVSEVVVAIGPEGDFSPQEYAKATQSGWSGIDLGPLVLRSETACLSALAVISYELRVAGVGF